MTAGGTWLFVGMMLLLASMIPAVKALRIKFPEQAGEAAPAISASTASLSASTQADRPISFREFLKISETNFEWDFGSYSGQQWDLANGVRQAAVRGQLKLEGRANWGSMSEKGKVLYPLQPIQKDHFIDWLIDIPAGTNNFKVSTYMSGQSNSTEGGYCDLHFTNEADARKWLGEFSSSLQEMVGNAEAEKALIHIAHHSVVGDRMGAKMAFEKAAREGKLRVWGQEVWKDVGVSLSCDELEARYWDYAELDLTTFILYAAPRNSPDEYEHENDTTQCSMVLNGSELSVYKGLRVNASQVLTLWPETRLGSPLSA